MYGKHFESMYEGSMYGAGVAVFAVWGYVIAHTKGSHVELNPVKLRDTLGGSLEQIEDAILTLTSPDAKSRHKAHGGRRLVKEGEFQYFVPSWEFYRAIRTAEERREYNRIAKQRSRARLSGGKPLAGEAAAVAALERGDEKEYERLTEQHADAALERQEDAARKALAGNGGAL